MNKLRNVTKLDLVDMIVERTGQPRNAVVRVIENVFIRIELAMRKGSRVEIREFGSFSTVTTEVLPRNTHTGMQLPKLRYTRVKFKGSFKINKDNK